jgi:glycerol-3-phosphate acyltransferase PlsY
MSRFLPLLLLASAYLIGSIPFSFLITRWFSGDDIRTRGSGNVGATNVLRTQGKRAGLLALVLDLAKGWFAVWLARLILASPAWPFALDGSGGFTTSRVFWLGIAAYVAVLAHMFPAWLGFHGGKGVATTAGVFLGLNPAALGITAIVFFIAALASRYVSVGSVVSAAVIPLLMRFWFHEPFWLVVFTVAISITIILKHYSNIARIAGGEERRVPK